MNKNSFDLQQVKKSFSQAAQHYDRAAKMQKESGEEILGRLQYINMDPKVILDLGCGTGYFSEKLQARYVDATVIPLDFAYNMVQYATQHSNFLAVCADGACLPFADNSIDLIFSNMVIHWFPDLTRAFQEIKRVLRPEGLFLFSTLGPDTLKELRKAWQRADSFQHVNRFLDMHDVGDLLLQHQFLDPVMDMEVMTLSYGNVFQLMRELKEVGVHNINQQRNHCLTGKGKLKQMEQAYESYRDEANRLPVTYEIIYGHGWGQPDKSSEVNVSIADMMRQYHEK